MCREKIDPVAEAIKGLGSPLRVQGKDFASATAATGARITPACAGKRPGKMHQQQQRQDHPCVCREKTPHVQQAIHR